MNRLLPIMAAALFVLANGVATEAFAQAWPNKPVKVVIPLTPGSATDVMARIVFDQVSQQVGQPFIIENRPGAGNTIGMNAVAKAEPDGYTLMMINDNHALNPSVFKNIPYDSLKDFAPIGFVGSTPLVLAVHPSVPAKDVKSLVAIAKEKPGAITYASVGVGSASHLAGAMFGDVAKVELQHVPYRGGAPALIDLLAGHVNTYFLSPVISLENIKTGKLKALALAADKRIEILSDLPTMAEAGYPVEASYWFGLVAPAGTPPAVTAKLEKALAEVLAMPDVKKRLTEMGAIVTPLNGKQFWDYVGAEIKKWAAIVEKAGVKPE